MDIEQARPYFKRHLRTVLMAGFPAIMTAASLLEGKVQPESHVISPEVAAASVLDDNCPNPPNRIYPVRHCFSANGINWIWGVRLGMGITPNPTNMFMDIIDSWNKDTMTLNGNIQTSAALDPDAIIGVTIYDFVVDPQLDKVLVAKGIPMGWTTVGSTSFATDYKPRVEGFPLSRAQTNPRDLSAHVAYNTGLPQGGRGTSGPGNTLVEKTDQWGKYGELTIYDSLISSDNGVLFSRISSTGNLGNWGRSLLPPTPITGGKSFFRDQTNTRHCYIPSFRCDPMTQ